MHRMDMVGLEEIGISSMTSYELSLMAQNSNSRTINVSAVTSFVNCFQDVEVISQDAITAASLRQEFITQNYTINHFDLVVMAQAINRDLLLISDVWFDLPPTVDIKLAVWV